MNDCWPIILGHCDMKTLCSASSTNKNFLSIVLQIFDTVPVSVAITSTAHWRSVILCDDPSKCLCAVANSSPGFTNALTYSYYLMTIKTFLDYKFNKSYHVDKPYEIKFLHNLWFCFPCENVGLTIHRAGHEIGDKSLNYRIIDSAHIGLIGSASIATRADGIYYDVYRCPSCEIPFPTPNKLSLLNAYDIVCNKCNNNK